MKQTKQLIHIFGASGSGVTTLGKCISEKLGWYLMDSDSYYWLPTDPPFTQAREKSERVRLIKQDFMLHEKAVLSGSVSGWGDELIPLFTLAVRLVTDTDVRLDRIRKREYERSGDRILPGGDMYEQHRAFIQWAAEYDDGDVSVRSRRCHDEWQKRLQCPLLILSGHDSPEYNADLMIKALGLNI